MPFLAKPLADRLSRPLASAVLWGLLATAVGAVLGFAAGAGEAAVRWAGDGFGQFTWSWQVVRGVAAVVAPLAIVSSTWACSFASTQTAPAGRALAASAAGILVLIALVRLEWPSALFAAAAVAWSLAIPFETWWRLGARLVVPAAATAFTPVAFTSTSPWAIALAVAFSFPAAALAIAGGEAAWRLARTLPTTAR